MMNKKAIKHEYSLDKNERRLFQYLWYNFYKIRNIENESKLPDGISFEHFIDGKNTLDKKVVITIEKSMENIHIHIKYKRIIVLKIIVDKLSTDKFQIIRLMDPHYREKSHHKLFDLYEYFRNIIFDRIRPYYDNYKNLQTKEDEKLKELLKKLKL